MILIHPTLVQIQSHFCPKSTPQSSDPSLLSTQIHPCFALRIFRKVKVMGLGEAHKERFLEWFGFDTLYLWVVVDSSQMTLTRLIQFYWIVSNKLQKTSELHVISRISCWMNATCDYKVNTPKTDKISDEHTSIIKQFTRSRGFQHTPKKHIIWIQYVKVITVYSCICKRPKPNTYIRCSKGVHPCNQLPPLV